MSICNLNFNREVYPELNALSKSTPYTEHSKPRTQINFFLTSFRLFLFDLKNP